MHPEAENKPAPSVTNQLTLERLLRVSQAGPWNKDRKDPRDKRCAYYWCNNDFHDDSTANNMNFCSEHCQNLERGYDCEPGCPACEDDRNAIEEANDHPRQAQAGPWNEGRRNRTSFNYDRGDGYYIQIVENKQDLGEGPWDNLLDAADWLGGEVGVPARVVELRAGRCFRLCPPFEVGAHGIRLDNDAWHREYSRLADERDRREGSLKRSAQSGPWNRDGGEVVLEIQKSTFGQYPKPIPGVVLTVRMSRAEYFDSDNKEFPRPIEMKVWNAARQQGIVSAPAPDNGDGDYLTNQFLTGGRDAGIFIGVTEKTRHILDRWQDEALDLEHADEELANGAREAMMTNQIEIQRLARHIGLDRNQQPGVRSAYEHEHHPNQEDRSEAHRDPSGARRHQAVGGQAHRAQSAGDETPAVVFPSVDDAVAANQHLIGYGEHTHTMQHTADMFHQRHAEHQKRTAQAGPWSAEGNRPIAVLKTEDGYTFYRLANGKVVDNLDPSRVDMSWPSYDEFQEAMNPDGMRVESDPCDQNGDPQVREAQAGPWNQPADVPEGFDDFLEGYVECALWASTDNRRKCSDSGCGFMDSKRTEDGGVCPRCGGEEWRDNDDSFYDEGYGFSDFSDEAKKEMTADCQKFWRANGALVNEHGTTGAQGHSEQSMAGHQFFLDRNHYAAAFKEADYPDEVAEKLDKFSESMGSQEGLYLGDDGKLYF